MNVALICGCWPPERCGVGDYARQLSTALQRRGVRTSEIDLPALVERHGPYGATRILARQHFDIAHVQYPSVGYGRSLLPMIVPKLVARTSLVTIHEYSIASWKKRPLYALFGAYDARLYSNEYEQSRYVRAFGLRRGADLIIPIGSNIPKSADTSRTNTSVCYFGLLMPNKGIEDFLELVEISRKTRTLSFSLIGGAPARFADYARHIVDRSRSLDIAVHLDLEPSAVAAVLARHKYAYLPFPDGASAKRGSLLASLLNGLIVLTTHGANTPAEVKKATIGVDSAAHAALILERMSGHQAFSASLYRAMQDFSAAHSWETIASRHVHLYDTLLESRPRPA